jgi:CysZ protein
MLFLPQDKLLRKCHSFMNPANQNPIGSLSGPALLLQGAKLLWHSKVRWLILSPLLINILLFSSLTLAAGQWLGGWLEIYALSFTIFANLIGSPFYGVVAERILIIERGEGYSPSNTSLLQIAWQSFVRQLQLLGYFIPRTIAVALVTLIISFMPLINLLAPVIAGAWAAWSLSIQYLDYGAEADQVPFQQLLALGASKRWQGMGFGFTVLMASAIPLLNLLALPAAVIGGTLLWCRDYGVKT